MNALELMMLEMSLRAVCPSLELRKGEPMSRYTSFKVGGPAALMALPKTGDEAALAIQAANTQYVKPFFLGNGSNLLVSDAGYDGFVLKLGGELAQSGGEGTALKAGAAIPLARLALDALDRGLTGLEFASGIPGTLGGAVVMNAGAYGGEMKQVVRTVTYLDENGAQKTCSAEECDFSYRHSVFSGHPEWLVIGAELALTPGDPAQIKARMDELADQRKTKQPLDLPSAGSTFKRPAPLADGTPVYAAALIEQCGCKGLRVGGAQVSEKHAGFVVNTGGATAADILELIRQVRERVLAQTGIGLELEVRTLGV